MQRVADRKADGLRPFLELLPVGSIPGDEPFLLARRAHQPPLVMVAAQPDLCDVFKLPILVNLAGIQMAMVVNDRLFFGVLVVEMFCGLGVQEKILIHKRLHFCPL